MNHLLLLHGAIGAASQFDELTTALNGDFTLSAPDFDGHGLHAASGGKFRTVEFARAVPRYLDESGIGRADIFGFSMGGFVALQLAHEHPDRVGKIFTLGTKIFWSPEDAASETRKLDPDRMMEKIPEFVRTLQQRHPSNDWRSVVLKTAEMMRDLGRTNPLCEDALMRIGNRVRIGLGDRDSMVSLAETEHAYRSLPNAELQILPDTHHPFERAPVKLLADSLRAFLAD